MTGGASSSWVKLVWAPCPLDLDRGMGTWLARRDFKCDVGLEIVGRGAAVDTGFVIAEMFGWLGVLRWPMNRGQEEELTPD